jgi:hypothetical protein
MPPVRPKRGPLHAATMTSLTLLKQNRRWLGFARCGCGIPHSRDYVNCCMRRSTLLLLVCCGLLAAAICYELTYYDALSDAPLPPSEEDSWIDASYVDPQGVFPPISHFREIAERPLFSPSRRPAPPTHIAAMDAYRLRGIFSSGKRKIGIVERLPDGTSIRVSEQEVVGAWRVELIYDEFIVLSNSTHLHTLRIAQAGTDNIASSYGGSNYGDNDVIHQELMDSDFEEEVYAENDLEEEITMQRDLRRRSGHADHPRLRPDQRAYAAGDRALNYAPAVPRKPLRLPRPPPPVL